MSPRTRKLCTRPDAESNVATLEAPPIASYSDVLRKRLRADVVAYRALVERALANSGLVESDIVEAYETLQRLGLSPGQLEQDVEALREHKRNREKWEAAVAREPEERARLREINAELEVLKQRMGELRMEAHRLGGMKAVGYLQRCNELAGKHPHVLAADVDRAVELLQRSPRSAVSQKVPT